MTPQVKGQNHLRVPEALGKRLLIAMDTTADCLQMVREVASCLPYPSETHITLFHYVAPIYWEHGGYDIETVHLLEKQVWAQEREQEKEVDLILAQAQTILRASGVSYVRTKKCWAAHDIADAVLKELDSESYTAVIMGGHLHNRLLQIFIHSPVDVVCQHAQGVIVWIVDADDYEGGRISHQYVPMRDIRSE